MRFRSAVLLAALAIAPVCAERIKDSNERPVVDSMLSTDGVDCSGGGLCSGGDKADGGRGRQWQAVVDSGDGRLGRRGRGQQQQTSASIVLE
jgi:hypothetical protein